MEIPQTPGEWNEREKDHLPGHLDMELLSVGPDEVRARMPIDRRKCGSHGPLHAGAIVSLAATACGIATLHNLPADAANFATVDLTCNLVGAAAEGDAVCIARPVHKGRTTQVWDAEVLSAITQKRIAVFRCTQMILHS
jgi:uncharacterized protein (TIGR00369 family)